MKEYDPCNQVVYTRDTSVVFTVSKLPLETRLIGQTCTTVAKLPATGILAIYGKIRLFYKKQLTFVAYLHTSTRVDNRVRASESVEPLVTSHFRYFFNNGTQIAVRIFRNFN